MNLCHGMLFPQHEQHYIETLNRLKSEDRSFLYPSLARGYSYLQKHRTAIDIGAHVGLWSIWLTKLFNQVIAFEPVDEYSELFKLNMGDTENWQLQHVALGSQSGHVALKTNPVDTGQAFICGPGSIEMRTLDSYHLNEIDLIKIDVEGYELSVVQGAEQTLLNNKPIVIIEQRGCDVINFGGERDEALEFLVDLGMRQLSFVDNDFIMGWQ